MSEDVDLAGMLADVGVSGAYYVSASGREALADSAQRLEYAFVAVDLSGCTGHEAAIARIASALDFPDWFGGNWDALADALNDLSWRPADGYVLLLEHGHGWQQADRAGFDVLLDIGNDVAYEWSEHGVPFWLLIAVPSTEL